jgi:hypothetical protein
VGGHAAPPRWREHYALERAALGDRGLDQLLARARPLARPDRGAVLVPHVHLASCGLQLAALANAIIASAARDVLAIGPLHRLAGELGDEQAGLLRAGAYIGSRFTALHGSDGLAAEEFCWDNLSALVARAAARRGVAGPRLHLRSACALPDDPALVPGMDEARALLAGGAALVATVDHLHHGIGYGMTPARSRSDVQGATWSWALERITGALAAAGAGQAQQLRALCREDRSDGCDVLLTLRHLIPGRWHVEVLELVLASYAAALEADHPTWVAAALVRIASDPR